MNKNEVTSGKSLFTKLTLENQLIKAAPGVTLNWQF
jgi:hypothetical protein